MFTYIKLKNYKSLVDIKVDFTNNKNEPKNLILIYGENGGGKSNLVSAFNTLDDTMRTFEIKDILEKMLQNADKESNKSRMHFLEMLKSNFRDLQTIIEQSLTINSENNMILEYGFNINGKNGRYYIETNKVGVIKEELYYTINQNNSYHFKIETNNININASIFKDKVYNEELSDKIKKFWGKHTFLAILNNELKEKNNEYVEERISTNLLQVIDFFKSVSYRINSGNTKTLIKSNMSNMILDRLLQGDITIEKESKIDNTEEFLNQFFTHLYADIKNVYYKKQIDKDRISYSLWCKKIIGNKIRDIEFNIESTGTLGLLDLIPPVVAAIVGKTSIIDEFDTGIHDLLVKNIMMGINNSIKGQLILTTHNTLLMESNIPHDSLYFIIVDDEGNKEVPCLNDYEKRTFPKNNVRDLYLKGMYDGIPSMVEIDFDEILSNI